MCLNTFIALSSIQFLTKIDAIPTMHVNERKFVR